MSIKHTFVILGVLAMAPSVAMAQGTVRGAADGADAGAEAAGPVGAVVGGAVGAAAGTVGGVAGCRGRSRLRVEDRHAPGRRRQFGDGASHQLPVGRTIL